MVGTSLVGKTELEREKEDKIEIADPYRKSVKLKDLKCRKTYRLAYINC